MATYVSITRGRLSGDPEVVKRSNASLIEFFSSWSPPAGLTLTAMHSSLDSRVVVGIWETDDPLLLSIVAVQFSPWADIEIIQTLPTVDIVAATVAAGALR